MTLSVDAADHFLSIIYQSFLRLLLALLEGSGVGLDAEKRLKKNFTFEFLFFCWDAPLTLLAAGLCEPVHPRIIILSVFFNVLQWFWLYYNSLLFLFYLGYLYSKSVNEIYKSLSYFFSLSFKCSLSYWFYFLFYFFLSFFTHVLCVLSPPLPPQQP